MAWIAGRRAAGATGWRAIRVKDPNFIRIRSRRRSIPLTLRGHVNSPLHPTGCARPRSPLPVRLAVPGRRSGAIAINNFVGYRAGPRGPASPAIFIR